MTQEGSFNTRRLKKINARLRCPNCHYENSVNPEETWICSHCKKSWNASTFWRARWFSRRGILVHFFSVALPIWLAGILIILIVTGSREGKPLSALKESALKVKSFLSRS